MAAFKNMSQLASERFRGGDGRSPSVFDPAKVEHIFTDGSYTEAVRRRLASVDGLAEAYEGWRSLRSSALADDSVRLMCARAWRALYRRLLGAFGNAVGRDMVRIEEMALSPWFSDDMEEIVSSASAA